MEAAEEQAPVLRKVRALVFIKTAGAKDADGTRTEALKGYDSGEEFEVEASQAKALVDSGQAVDAE